MVYLSFTRLGRPESLDKQLSDAILTSQGWIRVAPGRYRSVVALDERVRVAWRVADSLKLTARLSFEPEPVSEFRPLDALTQAWLDELVALDGKCAICANAGAFIAHDDVERCCVCPNGRALRAEWMRGRGENG